MLTLRKAEMFSYTVDKNNVVNIFNSADEQETPCVVQPQWPAGQPWADKAEAEAWAKLYVEASNDPTIDPIPGHSPDAPTRPRPAKAPEPEEPVAIEAPAE